MQRSHFHRLLLAVLLLPILGTAYLALAFPPGQEAPPAARTADTCASCHLDYHAAWLTGAHAIAFTRESFQQAWQQQNGSPACLECHTTNFEPPTGQFLAENVQCEACHGLTPANHPPESIVIRADAGMCRDCHAATFVEFRRSKHAFPHDREALGCATCHDPHGQRLRFETVDLVCLDCHEAAPDNYVHVTHRSMETDLFTLNCASCHMYNTRHDELHQLSNHTMLVDTVPCSDCHQEMAKTGEFSILLNLESPIVQERDALRVRVERLEAEAARINPDAQASAQVVQWIQGALVGLFLAVAGVWLVLRRRGANGNQNTPEKDE